MNSEQGAISTAQRMPPNAGKGRKAGSRNKITLSMKKAIEQAFWDNDGIAWLGELMREEPKVFATLLLRLIPQEQAEASEEDNNPIHSDPDSDLDD